jgi:hypothetical protein
MAAGGRLVQSLLFTHPPGQPRRLNRLAIG